MIELFGKVWPAMTQRVINTHEEADHVWGNLLFTGAAACLPNACGRTLG